MRPVSIDPGVDAIITVPELPELIACELELACSMYSLDLKDLFAIRLDVASELAWLERKSPDKYMEIFDIICIETADTEYVDVCGMYPDLFDANIVTEWFHDLIDRLRSRILAEIECMGGADWLTPSTNFLYYGVERERTRRHAMAVFLVKLNKEQRHGV